MSRTYNLSYAREDYTSTTPKIHRILDTLARIFTFPETCVAVGYKDERLLISHNNIRDELQLYSKSKRESVEQLFQQRFELIQHQLAKDPISPDLAILIQTITTPLDKWKKAIERVEGEEVHHIHFKDILHIIKGINLQYISLSDFYLENAQNRALIEVILKPYETLMGDSRHSRDYAVLSSNTDITNMPKLLERVQLLHQFITKTVRSVEFPGLEKLCGVLEFITSNDPVAAYKELFLSEEITLPADLIRLSKDSEQVKRVINGEILGLDFLNLRESISEQNYVQLPPQAKVHAEMIVLGEFFSTSNTIIPYIGISKLCCYSCDTVIKFVQKLGLDCSTRGTHGKLYSNWAHPKFLDDISSTEIMKLVNPFLNSFPYQPLSNIEDSVLVISSKSLLLAFDQFLESMEKISGTLRGTICTLEDHDISDSEEEFVDSMSTVANHYGLIWDEQSTNMALFEACALGGYEWYSDLC